MNVDLVTRGGNELKLQTGGWRQQPNPPFRCRTTQVECHVHCYPVVSLIESKILLRIRAKPMMTTRWFNSKNETTIRIFKILSTQSSKTQSRLLTMSYITFRLIVNPPQDTPRGRPINRNVFTKNKLKGHCCRVEAAFVLVSATTIVFRGSVLKVWYHECS